MPDTLCLQLTPEEENIGPPCQCLLAVPAVHLGLIIGELIINEALTMLLAQGLVHRAAQKYLLNERIDLFRLYSH